MGDSKAIRAALLAGMVIPAHPLALTAERRLDERRQRALTRYYRAAGARGIAVGVHTTQFAIREPRFGLLAPVLELAQETAGSLVKVAGICGLTPQALSEATLARDLGYDAGLLSLAAFAQSSNAELLEHCRRVGEIIPLFGFYLQPAVGGRVLDYDFWREFFEIDNVVAVKIAPFNRYQTVEVVRALAISGRHREIALYTGNDDNFVADLLTEFRIDTGRDVIRVQFAGGLLGQWAVWTKRAVELLEAVHECRQRAGNGAYQLLEYSAEMTDANGVLFDAQHNFAGCIAGLHEVLRRQRLLEGRWCIDPAEDLSPGQMEEIDRIYKSYPHLNDDHFVEENLDSWLRD